MGFITFNETYYSKKLDIFENKKLTETDIYEIQQLLKVLDDLIDEGYTNLNNRMEEDFLCRTRLRALLKKKGVSPFIVKNEQKQSTFYTTKEYELSKLLESLMDEAKEIHQNSQNSFLKDIYKYCEWIEYEEDSAYVFLLRDTLLPYIYFKNRYDKNVYPWLISRKFLEDITGIEFVDDDIRLPIYEALEKGYTNFEDCFAFCKKEILDVLDNHQELKQILLDLLASIKEKRIVVIESGYMGTIPMMLKVLDDRVTFKLYTTAPFLYETYKDYICCCKYEDIRKFETVYSQNLLTRYASLHDNKFYVNISKEDQVIKNSLKEINEFIKR